MPNPLVGKGESPNFGWELSGVVYRWSQGDRPDGPDFAHQTLEFAVELAAWALAGVKQIEGRDAA